LLNAKGPHGAVLLGPNLVLTIANILVDLSAALGNERIDIEEYS
jgi:hypothetical protein